MMSLTLSFTDPAREHLHRYLRQVRHSLAGASSVDADEVVRDVEAHIGEALEGAPQPVPLPDLEAVLARLGSPLQWVPEDELPLWRRIVTRLRSGPEDWRLAYLALGLLLLLPLFPPVILLSFLLARAALSLAEERGEAPGAQRWLLFPPLLLIDLPLLLALLAWPVPAVLVGLEEMRRAAEPGFSPAGFDFWIASLPWAAAALGLWWGLVGLLSAWRPGAFRAVFHPFLERLAPRHGGWLAAVGLLLLAGGLAAGLMLAPGALP